MKLLPQLVFCTLSFFISLSASAQLLDKKALTLEAAQKIAAASLAEARANNWNVIIAVVDEGGHLRSEEHTSELQSH